MSYNVGDTERSAWEGKATNKHYSNRVRRKNDKEASNRQSGRPRHKRRKKIKDIHVECRYIGPSSNEKDWFGRRKHNTEWHLHWHMKYEKLKDARNALRSIEQGGIGWWLFKDKNEYEWRIRNVNTGDIYEE